ncbi:MAG: hypothetical protein ACYC6P_03385 [Ignavibacteriaceae bacterium]
MNKKLHAIYISSFFIIGIASTLLLAINGYQYYSTPLLTRFFNPQDILLKPSGFIGQGLGVLGSLMMIAGVAVYMIRKRIRFFFNFGYLKNWLELHIFLCTLGPIFILFHTAFKFGGIVAVSFWSMTAVVLSGIVGRFLYVQIPHTIQGQMIGMDELNAQNENLSYQLKNVYKIPENIFSEIEEISSLKRYKNIKLRTGIIFIMKDFFGTKSVIHRLKHELALAGVPRPQRNRIVKTTKTKLIVSRRIGLLKTMQKFFKYWHVVHLPFAILMFVIMLIHIAVTVAFGYRWIF